MNSKKPYWNASLDDLYKSLGANENGLSAAEAEQRLAQYGPNQLAQEHKVSRLGVFLNQFKSPLMMLLLFATAVSALLQDWEDALIILVIVLGSAFLSAWQEYRASIEIESLRARIAAKSKVLREGRPQEIPSANLVPGDIVLLSAGSLVPADGVLTQAKDLYVSQAALTGEAFPVMKEVGTAAVDASLSQRTNCVFMGTNVRSGTARALIVDTGRATAYGQVADRLQQKPPETEFEQGIREFSSMIVEATLVLTLAVFFVNVLFHKPVVDSLLFSVALAVGMAPEMLPGIMTITLSQGAHTMAGHGVIVRHLPAIENLGSMDVLCTDKTGTLTEGQMRLDCAADVTGQPSAKVLRYAYLNAHLQSGLSNPLDEAIVAAAPASIAPVSKLDEIPYDFGRKRLSVVVEEGTGPDCHDLLITKGALNNVLAICSYVRNGDGSAVPKGAQRVEIQQRYAAWSGQGLRVLGVATKQFPASNGRPHGGWSANDECDMTFEGFLVFVDPPKASAPGSIADLARQGVRLKIITGDNKLVALHTAKAVHLPVASAVTGAELNNLSDEGLRPLIERTDLFAEVDPMQKERIILALRKAGHVVGFLGDGINDAPALHNADVGISVDSAVDVAKQAADMVLLQQDLHVLSEGITLGRNAFANTLKYIYAMSSSNFGNMFSMAGTSLFLPFLPMLPKQILLENLLSDVPMMTVASDNVDPEFVERPVHWNISFIRKFMVVFGSISSVFDYLTFGLLLWVVHSAPSQFQTGWFVESLFTELFVMLVMRTRRVFYQSQPGKWLMLSTLAVATIGVCLPYSPLAGPLGFTPLPAWVLALIFGITALYVLTTEIAKRAFYRRVRV